MPKSFAHNAFPAKNPDALTENGEDRDLQALKMKADSDSFATGEEISSNSYHMIHHVTPTSWVRQGLDLLTSPIYGIPTYTSKSVNPSGSVGLNKKAAMALTNEIAILRSVGTSSNFIVPLFDDYHQRDTDFPVLIYALPTPPITLQMQLDKKQQPENPCKAVYDLIQALHFLHIDNLVIHGNVAPKNMIYDSRSGNYKLTGFENSVVVTSKLDAIEKSPINPDPLFQPPEAKKIERQVDGKTEVYLLLSTSYDLWALGVLMVHLLTSELPQSKSQTSETPKTYPEYWMKRFEDNKHKLAPKIVEALTDTLKELETNDGVYSNTQTIKDPRYDAQSWLTLFEMNPNLLKNPYAETEKVATLEFS